MYSLLYILMKYLTLILSAILLGGLIFAAGCVDEPAAEPVLIGDNVTVEFTAYIGDTAMVTSSTEKYQQLLNSGQMPTPLLLINNPSLVAGSTTDDDYLKIQSKVGSDPYWFLIGEYNVMAANMVGMKPGETKTFPIYAAGTDQKTVITTEEAEALGFDLNTLKPGDIVTYTRIVSDTDVDEDGNFNPNNTENEVRMIRDMLILAVTDEGVTLQDTYDTIEMKILVS